MEQRTPPKRWTASAGGRFVTSVRVRSDSNPDVSYLTQRVKRALDLQVPLEAKVVPSVDATLTSLQLDPDHMLSRLFLAGEQPKVSAQFGSMGPRAATLCSDSQA